MSTYTTAQLEAAVSGLPDVTQTEWRDGQLWFHRVGFWFRTGTDGHVRYADGRDANMIALALRLTLDAPPTPASVAAEIRAMLPGEDVCVTHHVGRHTQCFVGWSAGVGMFSFDGCETAEGLVAEVREHFAAEIAAAKRPPLPELSPDSDWAVAIEDGKPAYREWRDGETIYSTTHGVVKPAKSVRKCAAYILTRRRTHGNCANVATRDYYPANKGFCNAIIRPISFGRDNPEVALDADATACPCWKERQEVGK